MRFGFISNDLKCILFEEYEVFRIKSPIHVYQDEILVPRLSMNLAGMYSEPVSTVPDSCGLGYTVSTQNQVLIGGS
jgi:hypothetical protein